MTDPTYSPPDVARGRINALYKAARHLSIETGGDPAECAFELVCAAILILHEGRPSNTPARMIAGIAADAEACVEEWFADQLKQIRCKHG